MFRQSSLFRPLKCVPVPLTDGPNTFNVNVMLEC